MIVSLQYTECGIGNLTWHSLVGFLTDCSVIVKIACDSTEELTTWLAAQWLNPFKWQVFDFSNVL